MEAPTQYMEELRSDLGLYPTWLPFDQIDLGAFGTIKRGQFYADGTLTKDLGIELEIQEQPTDGNLRKSRGIKLLARSSTKADVGLVDLSLGVDLRCEREHAWMFAARGVSAVRIANIHRVQNAVLEAHDRGLWRREWLVVTELRRTTVLNVVIARSRNTSGRIVAKGNLPVADALLGEDATFEFNTDDVFIVKNHKDGTPLYGLRKLKGFLGQSVKPIRGGALQEDTPTLEVTDDDSFSFDA